MQNWQNPQFTASANAWGPRTGNLLPPPAISSGYEFMHQENGVKNDSFCMPPDLRAILAVLDEEPSHTNVAFFRRSNRERLHAAIIDAVKKQSGNAYDIGRQSDEELQQLMIVVYQEEAMRLVGSAIDIARKLNDKVVKEAAENIIQNVTQYLYFVREINAAPPDGPALPAPVRTKDKVLTSKV
jgi:hypothetical protein